MKCKQTETHKTKHRTQTIDWIFKFASFHYQRNLFIEMERITWESFLNDIKIIYNLSQKLNDNWQLIVSVSDVFLKFECS